MAYVSVPKDLTKVKNKVAFNLTKRQLICIGIGAAMGIPSYFLLRNVMGNSNAATVMVLLMLPAFLFAMYSSLFRRNMEEIQKMGWYSKWYHPEYQRSSCQQGN